MGSENVYDPENASIDQIKGTLKAIEMGYKKIAVTIVSAEDVKKLRDIEKENEDVNIYIFVAHVTKMSEEDALTIFENADVVTGCASKYIREVGEEKRMFFSRRFYTYFWCYRSREKVFRNENREELVD